MIILWYNIPIKGKIMIRYLLIAAILYSPVINATDVDIGPQSVVRNMSNAQDYSVLFNELRENHIEFSLLAADHNVTLSVNYYQQYNIVNKDFTISVIEQATEIFFDWVNAKGYTITDHRRSGRSLSIYDLDYNTLNDISVVNFTSIARQKQIRSVNGLYEAYRSPDNSNSILIGSNRPASELSRATTIAHELAHWWCDYFRIYDRYYVQADGTIDMEGPAYEFQRYFQTRYNR
jgi:hypothetical protein